MGHISCVHKKDPVNDNAIKQFLDRLNVPDDMNENATCMAILAVDFI